MKNGITELFDSGKRNILSVFYTAGFPAFEDTVRIAKSLQAAGVDLIEIGIPFSDPVADGPVIQESNKIALENGMTLKKLLGQVKEIRSSVKTPVILMGYINPVLQFGVEEFCRQASQAGVDGVILPDLPMDEYSEYKSLFDSHNLSFTFLVAPMTSDERIRKADQATQGFIYAVSASSTTGAKNGFTLDQEDYFRRLRDLKLKNPHLIGFGISTRETFLKACEFSSGAIVGSAFIKMLRESTDLDQDIRNFVTNIRG